MSKFCAHFVLKSAAKFTLCAATPFKYNIKGFGGHGKAESSPQNEFYPKIRAKFYAHFVLKSAVNFEFCAPTLFEKMEGRLPGPVPQRPILVPARFCVHFVLKSAVNFEFCTPILFDKMERRLSGPAPPPLHQKKRISTPARFCTPCVL